MVDKVDVNKINDIMNLVWDHNIQIASHNIHNRTEQNICRCHFAKIRRRDTKIQ